MRFLLPILCAFLLFSDGYGQAPASRVIGEVTGFHSADGQILTKTDKGETVIVQLDEKTLYLRVPPGEKDLKKATKIALVDIGVGDRIYARGSMSEDQKSIRAASVIIMTKADLAQKHEHDRAEWQRRGITGTITALNPASREIAVSVRSPGGQQNLIVEPAPHVDFRRYAPDSVKFSDAKPSSFAELKVGDHVRVLGEKTPDGARMKPEVVVSGSFRNLAGTVTGINAQADEIKITDLQTRKPLTVRVNTDSTLRRMPPMMAAMIARRIQPAADAPARRPPVDFQQMLEKMPALSITELTPGDAVIVSSTTGSEPSRVTAITLLAGVEPLLTAAPRGDLQFGAWNFGDIGLP
jgi:hypothetical protein